MKNLVKVIAAVAVLLCAAGLQANAGEMNVLVNKLVEKGILTPYEGQIILAEAKEEAAMDLALGKASTAPSWTQKIKLKGDVRFRTQTDWGKGNNTDNGTRIDPAHFRLRQRVRARIGLEGKVNDQVAAGVLFVTGGRDPRSTNETLDDNFATQDVRFDQYYIKWMPEVPQEIGDATVWFGKFKNPFNKTELLWDSDINPQGTAFQYMSKTFELGDVPTNIYANVGWLLIDEERRTDYGDPSLWAYQGGIKADVIKDWDATINCSATFWDFDHIQHNSQYNQGDVVSGSNTNTYLVGQHNRQWRHDYDLVDFVIRYDAKYLFDWHFGHGVYTDLIWNADAGTRDFGWMIGAYIGDKKPKKPGQWKLWFNWRYLEQDAVPDFLPDSDFYGFVRDNNNPNGYTPGSPRAGGTNGQGINFGLQYAIFKNTLLCAEYYYSYPISVNAGQPNGYKEPWQLLQLDIKTKF
ncbi:MAG: putative porin [Candidatus Omnitrophota bacterium]|nr:putative porin [Candidatus Omnitrophota bacterium]